MEALKLFLKQRLKNLLHNWPPYVSILMLVIANPLHQYLSIPTWLTNSAAILIMISWSVSLLLKGAEGRRKLGFVLVVGLSLFCGAMFIRYKIITSKTMRLEAKIETVLKKYPNKTTLTELLHNFPLDAGPAYDITKLGDKLCPVSDKSAPSNTYWVISIWAEAPRGFGRSYTVFFDRK